MPFGMNLVWPLENILFHRSIIFMQTTRTFRVCVIRASSTSSTPASPFITNPTVPCGFQLPTVPHTTSSFPHQSSSHMPPIFVGTRKVLVNIAWVFIRMIFKGQFQNARLTSSDVAPCQSSKKIVTPGVLLLHGF
jgi:hypothetical protein